MALHHLPKFSCRVFVAPEGGQGLRHQQIGLRRLPVRFQLRLLPGF